MALPPFPPTILIKEVSVFLSVQVSDSGCSKWEACFCVTKSMQSLLLVVCVFVIVRVSYIVSVLC